MSFHLSTCPFCSCGCGLLLQAEGSRLIGSYPSVRPPASSSLCIRGWNCTASWSHPDRLTSPMVRRASGLVPATWREAIEEIVGRLHGARSAPLFAVGPSVANEDAFAVRRLADALGARACPTDLSGAAAARRALQRVLGTPYGLCDPDAIARADLVWLFGADAGECPQVIARVVDARRQGAAVVRFDVHVPTGDGSRAITIPRGEFRDIALLLERAAIEADLVPADVRAADGFDEFWHRRQETIASGGTAIAGSDQALSLVREFHAARRPVAIVGGRWLTSHGSESSTTLLLQTLALLGAGDRLVAAVGEANSWGVLDMLGSERVAEVACREETPDALFVIGDDLVRRSPRPAEMAGMLSALSTLVVIDRFATDSLPFAHVVLPSCGFAEMDGSVTSVFGRVQRWRRAVAAPGGGVPERVWMSRIGERLGVPANAQASGRPSVQGFGSVDDVSSARAWFEALQGEIDSYRSVPVDSLYAGTGREDGCALGGPVRLAFSVPEIAPAVGCGAGESYPLRLVLGSAAANWSTGIVTQRDEILRREFVESFVAASPSTLKQAGVKPGWPVTLAVPGGEATVTVRSDSSLPGDVVVLVPVAGSASAALRGGETHPGGCDVGIQPVPARLQRAGQG